MFTFSGASTTIPEAGAQNSAPANGFWNALSVETEFDFDDEASDEEQADILPAKKGAVADEKPQEPDFFAGAAGSSEV